MAKAPTKGELAALAVIDALHEAGWVDDGQTDTQTVRVGTARSPVYGGIGGELRTFGGRERLRMPGSDWKVTVGIRSVNFYRVGEYTIRVKDWQGVERDKNERGAHSFKGADTKDLDGVKARITEIEALLGDQIS